MDSPSSIPSSSSLPPPHPDTTTFCLSLDNMQSSEGELPNKIKYDKQKLTH